MLVRVTIVAETIKPPKIAMRDIKRLKPSKPARKAPVQAPVPGAGMATKISKPI